MYLYIIDYEIARELYISNKSVTTDIINCIVDLGEWVILSKINLQLKDLQGIGEECSKLVKIERYD